MYFYVYRVRFGDKVTCCAKVAVDVLYFGSFSQFLQHFPSSNPEPLYDLRVSRMVDPFVGGLGCRRSLEKGSLGYRMLWRSEAFLVIFIPRNSNHF